MTTFILLLLLLAAIFGVLGAVLKVTFVILMAFMLAAVIIAGLVAWGIRKAFGNGAKRFGG